MEGGRGTDTYIRLVPYDPGRSHEAHRYWRRPSEGLLFSMSQAWKKFSCVTVRPPRLKH